MLNPITYTEKTIGDFLRFQAVILYTLLDLFMSSDVAGTRLVAVETGGSKCEWHAENVRLLVREEVGGESAPVLKEEPTLYQTDLFGNAKW